MRDVTERGRKDRGEKRRERSRQINNDRSEEEPGGDAKEHHIQKVREKKRNE